MSLTFKVTPIPFKIAVVAGIFLFFSYLAVPDGWAGEDRTGATAPKLNVKFKKAESGNKYMLVWSDSCNFKFKTERPDKKNKRVLLCVPAAFTTKENTIDGVYVVDGTIHHRDQVNPKLGAAFTIVNNKADIIRTNNGKLLTKDWLKQLALNKGSMFQQFSVVHNGVASKFKDTTELQRRGLGISASGAPLIVESRQSVTINDFAKDVITLKVKYLVYLDMGAWSEGWIRKPINGEIIVIGLNRQDTKRQTNWVTFESP